MKRMIHALTVLLLLALAAGCGGSGSDSDDTGQDQDTAPVTIERAAHEDYFPGIAQISGDYDDTPRVYWFFNEGGVQIPPDNFFSQRAREEIGVAFIPINPEPADFEEILFEMLAAGQQIDIIMTWRDLQNRLVAEGLIQPVDQWLNEDYLPNLVRVSRIWDDVLMDSLRLDDGHIYAIPSVLNNVRPDTLDWIRADWLEYLGLEVPTTYNELTAVLQAFTNLNPAQDEDDHGFYPFMVSGLWSLGYIFQAYGADMHWYIADDGYLELGILSPRLVTVLGLLNTWYNEGLINPDFMYTFSSEVINAMMDGLVGYHRGWLGFYDAEIMAEFNPGANWIPILPLGSPYFDRGYSDYIRPAIFTRNQYSIHRDVGDIYAIFRLINWMNDDTATSAGYMTFEGAYWYQFGEKGVHWDVINGQFVGPGGPDTWEDPHMQAAAIRFALAYERDRWAGGAIRRFLNVFDTRWMGDDPHDRALIEWEQEHIIDAGLMATDIPLDSPHLARTILSLPDDDELHDFLATFTNWSDWGLFAETIAYPAISGQASPQILFSQWLEMANEAGYQEFRRLVTAHVGINEAEEMYDDE